MNKWLLLLIPLLFVRLFNGFGVISDHKLIINVSDCELTNQELIIINKVNDRGLFSGLRIFNIGLVLKSNNSFNPLINCFDKHNNDFTINQPLKITINESGVITYPIINNQDQRLYYDCRIITDCIVERKIFNGYLDPNSSINVSFIISCPTGNHNSTIKTEFVDELNHHHIITKQLIITFS